MKNLITIEPQLIGAETINSVNARELHANIESRQQFGNWIQNRIEKYGFRENEDYCSFNKSIKRENGATVVKEYIISLEMAKELAMVENTPKGREVRKYFIEVERNFSIGKKQFMQVREQVDLAISSLEAKSIEADVFKNKYYETLEMTNKLLIEKIDTIKRVEASAPIYYLQGKALTSEEKKRIEELYKKGYPFAKIARELNRGTGTISKYIKQQGVRR